jgi:hypothetical protein
MKETQQMKTTLNNWRRFLNEGQEQPTKVNRPLKRRKTDDPPSVRKRKLPFETFPGYDDRNGGLKQLALGIMEDEEIELLSEPNGDEDIPDEEEMEEACIGNPYRDANGHFTDRSDHSVYTTGYKGDNTASDCDHGKWKKNKSGTSHKCGRAPNGKKHPYVCKTGKLRENVIQSDTGDCYVKLDYLIALLKKEEEAILENDAQAQQQALAQKCQQMGYTTPQKAFQNLTLTLNSLQKAMKGDLMKDK